MTRVRVFVTVVPLFFIEIIGFFLLGHDSGMKYLVFERSGLCLCNTSIGLRKIIYLFCRKFAVKSAFISIL